MPTQYFKTHHEEYLRQNHKVLSVDRLVKGLENLRLVVGPVAVKAQLNKMGLSWLEPSRVDIEKQKERKKQTLRSAQYRYQIKQEQETKQQRIKKVIEKHYPAGGAVAVKDALAEANIYLTSQKINALAKKYKVVRKITKKETRAKKLTDNLNQAYYKVRDYNEVNGTNFSIIWVAEDIGHIEDYYLSPAKQDLVTGLLKEIFNLGYCIRKEGAKAFRIWGEVKLS